MKYTKNMYLFFVDCIKVEQVSEEEQEKTGRTTECIMSNCWIQVISHVCFI